MSVRVLHVVKVAGISGAENHLLLLLPELRERGFEVDLVMLHEDEPGAHEFATRLSRDGIDVERLRLTRANAPLVFSQLARIVRRRRPAILHTHLVHADFHGLPAGRLARVPVLVSTKHGFNAFRDGGWEVIEDVQFVRNRIRNVTNGINLRGLDDGFRG